MEVYFGYYEENGVYPTQFPRGEHLPCLSQVSTHPSIQHAEKIEREYFGTGKLSENGELHADDQRRSREPHQSPTSRRLRRS